ncbi:MAG TPA: transposase [Anaerolineales bacterium]
MHNQITTDKHINNLINNLIEFRQALYQHGFTRLRDAQFELVDALLLSGPVRSFAELSLSPVFRRKWPSAYAAIYAAIQDGAQDTRSVPRVFDWLKEYLCSQVAAQGVQVFALDTSAWPRPRSPTLPERQYVHSPTAAVDGSSIVIGYAYSVLAWVVQERSSWALPVDVERISTDAVQLGVAQVKQLCQQRGQHKLYIIVGDGSYGNHRFLTPLRDQPCGVLVRLRRDRMLYREPPPYAGRGRPKVHGERFAFKASDSWGEPDQHLKFWDPRWGKVELQYWSRLHARQAPDTPFGVLSKTLGTERAQVHLERQRPPQALWLAWQGPAWPVEDSRNGAGVLWRYYQMRWTIEPSIRWRKRQLYWSLPQFGSAQACDRWTMLVSLAQWMTYLARPLVQDKPLPWQKAQNSSEPVEPTKLTPGRVQQGLGAIFMQIGTPTGPPKTRGKSPGWPKGRPSTTAAVD